MTEEVLVQLIFVLCTGSSTPNSSFKSSYDKTESSISCFEDLTNCSVGSNGKILTVKEFKDKCLKK